MAQSESATEPDPRLPHGLSRLQQRRGPPELALLLTRGPLPQPQDSMANENRMAVVWGARWNKAAAGWLEGGKELTCRRIAA